MTTTYPGLPGRTEELVPADVYESMVALRRDLHRHPELSFQEEQTARRITARLEEHGLAPRRMAGTGLVLDLPGARQGPRIALRADMDALPVQEETGLAFASAHAGVMHACGHDAHSAMLYGAAQLLAAGPPPPLPVRLVWQPAEEKGAGAPAMIAEGVLEGVARIFGGHVDRRFHAGKIVATEGTVNASTDTFVIDVHGEGGHGARPHEAVNSVVVGSLLVTAIQTIVSREVDPAHPSVVSVGSFQAGTAHNVIAAHAHLEGTVRSQDAGVRQHLLGSIRRIALAVGNLHEARVEVAIRPGTPALHNSVPMTDLARRAALNVVGEEHVEALRMANMGGEDFAWFLEEVEGCYVRFGSQVPGLEGHPAHSSRFDVDERALAAGAAWFRRVAQVAGAELAESAGPG